MDAGRELDDRIATSVMGWHRVDDANPCWYDARGEMLQALHRDYMGSAAWSPSTDIADAWQVIEHLRDLWTTATENSDGLSDDVVRPFDDQRFFEYLHRSADRRWPWAFLYVTPVAICLAALRAYEIDTHTLTVH